MRDAASGAGGCEDDFGHLLGSGEHGQMTGLDGSGGRFHALSEPAFELRVDGPIVGGHDVPGVASSGPSPLDRG